MSDNAPGWLNVMRSLNGTKEVPGPEANPVIVGMTDEIARRYPDMKWYCDLPSWDSDETAWCGVAAAYCCAMSGIRPPFKQKPAPDTDRFGWALAWADDDDFVPITQPLLGCICVLERSGGGHVTMYESTSGSNYMCRGGNQSNSVNLSAYPKSSVVALVWPKAAGPLPPAPRGTVQRGSTGADVREVQRILGIPVDGDFGPVTESAVKSFQRATGLSADGVVGPDTWAQLDKLDAAVKAGGDGLSEEQIEEITAIAKNSAIARYSWKNRGTPPPGYIPGMALAFGLAATMLKRAEEGADANPADGAAIIMAQANRGDPNTDALTWYAAEFAKQEMDISTDGIETLRALFALAIGLGMRESSGNCWEGRDMSASNVTADTCEASLHQTSWNIKTCAPSTMGALLASYWGDPNGFNETFRQNLSPTASMLDVYGSGEGARYQWLARYAPAFHVFVTGVGMRLRRQHWGPINRREAELRPEADDMLIEVQRVIEATPEPEPEPPEPVPPEAPTVEITTSGPVRIIVNGNPVQGGR